MTHATPHAPHDDASHATRGPHDAAPTPRARPQVEAEPAPRGGTAPSSLLAREEAGSAVPGTPIFSAAPSMAPVAGAAGSPAAPCAPSPAGDEDGLPDALVDEALRQLRGLQRASRGWLRVRGVGVLVAAALGAGVPRGTQGQGWLDSALVEAGCRRLPASVPALPVTVHLDSGGVRVTEGWWSSGAGRGDSLWACPRREVAIRLRRAHFLVPVGDPPFGVWAADSLGTAPWWRVGRPESVWPDSGAVDSLWRQAGAFATWRGALAVLGPRFHDAPAVPPVPPVPADPCAGGVGTWWDQPPVRSHDVERRDEARVVRADGTCVGVATLRRTSAGDRYVVAYPPCAGQTAWRLWGTLYVTRRSAIERAARGLACAGGPA